MKFLTQVDPIRQRVNLYCEVGGNDKGERFFAQRNGDTLIVPMGADPPLWDWFPMEIMRALSEAIDPRPPATERHLDDAIVIRDRLLTLVEEMATD